MRADREEDRHDLFIGDVRMDAKHKTVRKNGEIVVLTNKEYLLLAVLLRHLGETVTREELYRAVWEEPYLGNSRTVDVHISRLRCKLGWRKELISVMKKGYRLILPSQ